MGNRLILGLRKVTATRQLKANHSLTVKATKPRMQQNIQRQNKEGLGQERKDRIAETLYSLGTWFVSGIYE